MVCWVCPSVQAQDLALTRNRQEAPPETKPESAKPLKKVLQELESRYSVHFAFDPQLVDQKWVNVGHKTDSPLEKALDDLLTPMKLQYKKIDQGVYVIQQVAAEENTNAQPADKTPDPSNPGGIGGLPSIQLDPGVMSRLIAMRPAEFAVRGRVTDERGGGLPGVSVVIKGTTTGTTTDAEGNYSITSPDGNATLVFSFIGYTSQEVAISNQSTVNVSLVPDVQALSEIVVIGYGTQERTDVTGSVASVSAADLRRAPVATVNEAIQGRVPGVTISSSGQPGQASNINIRGIGSLNAGSGPLYVIDGVWTENLRDFNPADIESIQVLKDAATTAIYGSRGANGVVIITTRRGKSGAPVINFNAYAGVQNVVKKWDLTSAREFATINNLAYDNAGRSRMAGADAQINPQLYPDITNVDTDWQDALLKQGSVQEYTMDFSGGGENSNFLISGGYFNQQGTIVGPKFERYSLRLNSGLTKGRVKVTQNATFTRSDQRYVNGSPFIDIARMLPTIPIYDPNESTGSGYGYGSDANYTFGTNPLALQEMQRSTTLTNRFLGNIIGDVTIFDFLTYRLNLGVDYQNNNDAISRKFGRWSFNQPIDPAYLNEGRRNATFLLVENTLNFNRTFGRHGVSAVAGYTEQRNRFDYTFAGSRGYGQGPNYVFVLNAGSTTTPTVGGAISTWTKRSYLGRLTYDFDNRYLFTASIRTDGSSRFPKENRWATFGAASVGWRISEEKFFEDVPFISNLKLRASYGVNGNDALPGPTYPYVGAPISPNERIPGASGDYLYQGVINPNANYVVGTGQNIIPGSIQTQLESRDIKWESRYTTNVGLDLGLLEDRISLSADYYVSTTKDALVNPQLPLFLGNYGSDPFINLGKLENRGFEFVLSYQENRNAFTYGATANLTTIKNKVLALASPGQVIVGGGYGDITRTEVGHPVGSFYLLQMDGIFQRPEDVTGYTYTNPNTGVTGLIQPYASPGDVRYRDINNDGTINNQDRSYVGNPIPDFQYGVNLNAGYRGFDLSVFFQGVAGNEVFNGPRFWLDRLDDNGNYRRDLDYWTGPGSSNDTPRPLISGSSRPNDAVAAAENSRGNSTRWLENGSYFRLKNIQLGYTLPTGVTNRLKGLSRVRVYVTGQNVFTITKYTGLDPEVVGAQGNSLFSRGVDDGSFPNLRSFTGGLQVSF